MQEQEHHGPSYKNYVMVFIGLAAMTAVTVLISYSTLGEGSKEFIAFVIAAIKTTFVALIFMHLKFEQRTIAIFAIAPVLLAIVFILAIAPDIGDVKR